ncbi:uncharacterized protein LOC122256373 [Penaeus japonicus]|uniref:uncharacterized protein LOC122256373 n=1 Tax=Penaeus japonicus TaxID=27405 RepID=UPI001C70D4BC|nr:uncharacterized protein LOC122256373 [Penaeus japonicus]
MDVQSLTVVVRSDDKLEDLLEDKAPFEDESANNNVAANPRDYELDYDEETKRENKEDWKNKGEEEEEERERGHEKYEQRERTMDEEGEGSEAFEPQTLVRRKRETPADEGDTGASELTLIETNPPAGDMKPGMSIDYELVVVLPKLSTAIDLVIELFVMDAVSGVTPFALCNPRVDSIGAMIKNEADAAIAPADVTIDKTLNQDFGTFYDHAVLNFGKVKNLDTYNPTPTDKEPSTIRVFFTAILIKNTAYTNDTVIVTAGAEYDSERYVWVSQASHSYTMTPPETYPDTVTLAGPTQIAQWEGGTFSIDSIITTPFDTFTVEIYSPNDIHDKFSVTQLFLRGKGSDWACTLSEFDKVTYFESVTGRTNHRAIFESNLLLMNLDYGNLATEGTNANENELNFGFTIFVHDAVATETFEVGVGVLIGTTKVWTSNHTVTVLAGSDVPAGAAPASLTASPLVTDAQSAGTGTFEVRTTVPAGGLLMDCTVTAGAGDAVCGISWGDVGGNIAFLPKLEDVVVYLGETATFSFYVNTTGSTVSSDDLVLEVSFSYAGAPQDGTIDCSGATATLGGLSTGTTGTLDMSGTAAPLPDDLIWYEGGQSGLELKLTFPGVPYTNLLLEAAGDLDTTGWGSRIWVGRGCLCGARACLNQGSKGTINERFVLQKARGDSAFMDGVALDMGPSCGTTRTTSVPADYEVVVKVYYEMPFGQASFSAATSFNVSAGINMNNDLIWTSWEAFTMAVAPTTLPTIAPVVTLKPPSPTVVANGLVVGTPHIIEVTFKTFRQTTGSYKIKAEVDSTANIAICKIVLLHIGSSYPCVDPEPYFKDDIPYQHTKITHDPTDWGLSATLDLGVITNIGSGTSYPGKIADDDAISIGVLVKGITMGTTGTVTVTLDNTGTLDTPQTQTLSINSDLVPSLSATVEVDGADGTADAYDGVMKLVDFKVIVPEGYSQEAKFTVKHTSADLKLCFVAVYKAGKNLPCLIPSLTSSTWLLDTDAAQTIELNMLQVCHFKLSDNATENEVIVRAGVQFIATADTTASISGFLTEGLTAGAEVPFAMTFSVSAVYDYGNVTSVGFNLELLDNTTTTVTPGLRLPVGIVFTIPRDVTVPVELGVMTPSDGGRAYATVHGFRFVNDTAYGKNIGCLMPSETYETIITQNSSLSSPMIHSSQTDTMVVNLKYLTNTGVSHMDNTDLIQDDQVWLEADILVADHPNVSTSDIISITFAVKVRRAALEALG